MSPEGEAYNPLTWFRGRFGAFPPTFENLMRKAEQLDIQIIEEHGFPKELQNEPFILAPSHDGGLFRLQVPLDIFTYLRILKSYSEKIPTAVAMTDLNLILPKCLTKPLVKLAYSSIRGLNIIQIEIGNRDQTSQYKGMIQKAMDFTADGSVLIIFPTGRLSWEFNPQEIYHRGTAFLARYCNVPILPACTVGIQTWMQQSPIYVAFGKPIPPFTDRRDDPSVTEIIHRQINSLHDSLKNHSSTVTT